MQEQSFTVTPYLAQLETMAAAADTTIPEACRYVELPTSSYYRAKGGTSMSLKVARKIADGIAGVAARRADGE